MGGNRITVCACVYWCDISFFSYVCRRLLSFSSSIRSAPCACVCLYDDQIGCFVPASSASFRIVDQMFSRLCTHDRIENNASSFSLEVSLYLSSAFYITIILLFSFSSLLFFSFFIAFLSIPFSLLATTCSLLALFRLCSCNNVAEPSWTRLSWLSFLSFPTRCRSREGKGGEGGGKEAN